MTLRIQIRPFPTAEEIRARFAETGSVVLTAARCGVPRPFVLDAVAGLAR